MPSTAITIAWLAEARKASRGVLVGNLPLEPEALRQANDGISASSNPGASSGRRDGTAAAGIHCRYGLNFKQLGAKRFESPRPTGRGRRKTLLRIPATRNRARGIVRTTLERTRAQGMPAARRRSVWPKIRALAKRRGGCMLQERTRHWRRVPSSGRTRSLGRFDDAPCVANHTRSEIRYRAFGAPGALRTQFHPVKLHDRANQSAVRPRRAAPRLSRSPQRRPSWRGDGC